MDAFGIGACLGGSPGMSWQGKDGRRRNTTIDSLKTTLRADGHEILDRDLALFPPLSRRQCGRRSAPDAGVSRQARGQPRRTGGGESPG